MSCTHDMSDLCVCIHMIVGTPVCVGCMYGVCVCMCVCLLCVCVCCVCVWGVCHLCVCV